MPLWSWGWAGGGSQAASRAPLPQPGETVQIETSGEGQVGVYSARVRAVGLRRLFLELPEAPLPARASLTVSFIYEDALYRFETRVVGPVRAGSLTVARPRLVTKVQRRQYYRLPLESPTTFRVFGEDGRSASPPQAARLVNLSGGGALLAAVKPVPSGLLVSVRVPSGKAGEPLDIEAEALDCRVASQGTARTYLIRLHFFDAPRLAPGDRDAIIAYIFEQQRLLLRTRKLLR